MHERNRTSPPELTNHNSSELDEGQVEFEGLRSSEKVVEHVYLDEENIWDRLILVRRSTKRSFWVRGMPGLYLNVEGNGLWGREELWAFFGEICAAVFGLDVKGRAREERLVILVEAPVECNLGLKEAEGGLDWLRRKYLDKKAEIKVILLHAYGASREEVEDGEEDGEAWEEVQRLEEAELDEEEDEEHEKEENGSDLSVRDRNLLLRVITWVCTAKHPLNVTSQLAVLVEAHLTPVEILASRGIGWLFPYILTLSQPSDIPPLDILLVTVRGAHITEMSLILRSHATLITYLKVPPTRTVFVAQLLLGVQHT
ncbi:hypothetical protein DFH27DRAFT_616201 [Peziza echinospora]|nr:hypothetical protein DFH27DRAFT_616201 [Peziza echinospora]